MDPDIRSRKLGRLVRKPRSSLDHLHALSGDVSGHWLAQSSHAEIPEDAKPTDFAASADSGVDTFRVAGSVAVDGVTAAG